MSLYSIHPNYPDDTDTYPEQQKKRSYSERSISKSYPPSGSSTPYPTSTEPTSVTPEQEVLKQNLALPPTNTLSSSLSSSSLMSFSKSHRISSSLEFDLHSTFPLFVWLGELLLDAPLLRRTGVSLPVSDSPWVLRKQDSLQVSEKIHFLTFSPPPVPSCTHADRLSRSRLLPQLVV